MAALDQAGRGVGMKVGAEGDDEHVRVEGPVVGRDPSRSRVDARMVVRTKRTPGFTMVE